jgi:hypothetical protein
MLFLANNFTLYLRNVIILTETKSMRPLTRGFAPRLHWGQRPQTPTQVHAPRSPCHPPYTSQCATRTSCVSGRLITFFSIKFEFSNQRLMRPISLQRVVSKFVISLLQRIILITDVISRSSQAVRNSDKQTYQTVCLSIFRE